MTSLYKTPGVHIESAGDRYQPLEAVPTGVAGILGVTAKGPRNVPTKVSTFEQYDKVFGNDESFTALAVRGFFDNGGKTAYIVNVAPDGGLDPTPDDYIGSMGESERGLRALERIEDVDLVCAPGLMGHFKKSLGFTRPEHVMAVQRAMIEHCERLHDRFALLDSLPNMTQGEVLEWRRHFDSSHAALYYPWVKVRIGEEVGPPIPATGHIAGLYARADEEEGVHRAPANLPIEGIVDVSTRIKKRDRDHLFFNEVNSMLAFPSRGLRIWGARTLSSDQSFQQINVRRLFILIRKSIERSMQWAVFEPNDESLWKKVVRSVEVFLDDLWREGALVGGKKEEAFYVKCDEETNPPEQRDVGQLICEIGISPVKPAEFIIVRIHQFTRERTDSEGENAEQIAAPVAAG